MTVPLDSADESDASEDLVAIGAGGVDCGTSLKSCGSRCEPRASSLLGMLDSGMTSSAIGSLPVRGYFIEAACFLASSSFGVGCDSRLGRAGAGAAKKERSWYECRDCDPVLPSRSIATSFALRIRSGAIAWISCSGTKVGPLSETPISSSSNTNP